MIISTNVNKKNRIGRFGFFGSTINTINLRTMSQEIPDYEFSLNKASLAGDFSSLATVHNKNMKEIEKWMRAIVSKLSIIGGGEQTISNSYFELLMTQNRTVIQVNENLQTSDSITVNGYKLVRVNNPNGFPIGSSELRITDTDADRVTDFRTKLVSMMDMNGNHVYPIIRTDATKASILFHDGTALNTVDSNNTNRKYILIS